MAVVSYVHTVYDVSLFAQAIMHQLISLYPIDFVNLESNLVPNAGQKSIFISYLSYQLH